MSEQNQIGEASSHLNSSLWSQPELPSLPLNTLPLLTFKRRILKQLHLLSYYSGISSISARWSDRFHHSSVATILMYHSIPAPHEIPWIDPCNSLSAAVFEQQMRFLAQRRHVISLDQLVNQLENQEPIRRGTVAITFDDGYLNNLTVAAPILAKYDLPATLYLPTNYIATSRNQWIDELYSAFRARSQHHLCLDNQVTLADSKQTVDHTQLKNWDLADSNQAQAAYQSCGNYLIQASVEQRQALLAEIDTQLAPSAYPPRLTLNWNEVRHLQRQYSNITLGIHTANHIDLSTHSDQTTAEMQLSINHMIQATGSAPQHLAFPYNRCNPQAQSQVAASDIRSAVAVADDPVVRQGTSCYALPRLIAPHSMQLLKSWTNGGFPDVSQRLFGRVWTQPY